MVELKGTEKQVKWAESIRIEVLDKIEKAVNEYKITIADAEKEGKKTPKRYLKNIVALKNLAEDIKEDESSKKFIEEYRNLVSLDIWKLADIARER